MEAHHLRPRESQVQQAAISATSRRTVTATIIRTRLAQGTCLSPTQQATRSGDDYFGCKANTLNLKQAKILDAAVERLRP